MVKWIIGLNGSGKTVYLEEKLDEEIDKNRDNDIITNIRPVHYEGFAAYRIQALRNSEYCDEIFDYGELEVINNKIAIVNNEFHYTEYFINLLTLLCRNGDTIILDEPEFGLFGIEIDLLVQILQILLPTYENGFIATHCEDLLTIEPNNFYWCNKYQLVKIGENELYEHIGQF